MITPDEIKVIDTGSKYTVGELPQTHKTLRYLKSGALVCLFDGLDTMLNYVDKKMPEAKRDESSIDEGRSFHFFDTYDEAMKVYRHTPEKVVKFDPGELVIKDKNEAGSQIEYDVTGDFIDMGRHMEGLPDAFGSMHNGNARNRRVNVILNLSNYADMSTKDINHRGERILRLVDALEAGGVRVMLTAVESSECTHTEVILKRHEEPLTISDLAVVAHSDFLRRVIFRVCEYSETFQSGYGSAIVLDRSVTPEVIEHDTNNDELNIYIAGNMDYGIDKKFDKLERLLVWEMSKVVPELSSIRLDNSEILFNPNGARDEQTIREEGNDAIKGQV